MIEESSMLAAASSAVGAVLAWFASRLNANIKKTTVEAGAAIDLDKMRNEVDELLAFQAALVAEREERSEAERQALEAKVEAQAARVEELEAELSGVRAAKAE